MRNSTIDTNGNIYQPCPACGYVQTWTTARCCECRAWAHERGAPGSGRRAQGAGLQAQGAGRRAQGAGLPPPLYPGAWWDPRAH